MISPKPASIFVSQHQSTMKTENQCASSPSMVNVFDFSLFVLLRQDETERLQAPSMANKGAVAPPLESIATDSTSSLSTISTQDQEDESSVQEVLTLDQDQEDESSIHEVPQRKRSIFSPYWKKTGEKPLELTAFTKASSESVQAAEAPHNPGHERQDRLFPQAEKVVIPSTIPRRSIMGARASSYSNPSLSTFTPRAQTKKSASQSCLRTSRFSGSNSPPRSNSCSSAVGFSDQVDVVIYQKPVETFSEGGWSRFFSK